MKYVLKKLLAMTATLVAVSFLVFLAFSLIPGDPAVSMLGTQATPERLTALREQLGLNDPVILRYLKWLFDFIRGNMGTSYSYSLPVTQMILEKIPITLTLSLMAFLFMLLTSIPLGIYTAKHKDGKVDRVIYIINQILMSVPSFFMGILLTFLFGLVFRLFTPGGYVSYTVSLSGFLGYLIIPAIAIGLPKSAMAVKLLRSSVAQQRKLDYTRTAFSRGNSINGVLYHHILKNALIPVITFWGMAFADMVAGSIIIEQVFSIPGLGRILLTSISNRDYPVVEAIILLIAFVVIAANFIVDIVYRLVDPRISKTS